ncbi:MAG: hypothetical protein IPP02_13185 [Chitinophagaceae bacterium]|nr:hypothetical protein [Chitinophagaceae bacterium]
MNNTNLLSPGNYIVTVTGTSTGVITQTRDIVFTITPSAPVITTQPLGQTVCTGNQCYIHSGCIRCYQLSMAA